ncbi:NADH-quinone oxidoreductase subunit E [Amaricoccus macauensis]|uniref:NADH-quinone oxidoreductase subunit E n=1 Tax=Amaricoccus macauensis TaxID=57001 RepID=UPI003C7B4D7F
MLRRLHSEQPESFAFTPANQEWAKGQIAKYPEGRQASAVIPLLWRAQEQEGWVTEKAIEVIADMLGMAKIRVLEVATFYFMFQLRPVGSVAHVQVCGTTSCMICGAEDLMSVCKDKIAAQPHELSADGKFSWEEVECLGACANAPMAQIGKDYYEDLSAESLSELLDALSRGEVPAPGSRKGRFASEPETGLTSLEEGTRGFDTNASVTLALQMQDTIKRITGDEKPVEMPEKAPEGSLGPKPALDAAGDTDVMEPQEAPTDRPTPDSAADPKPDGDGEPKPVDGPEPQSEAKPKDADESLSKAEVLGASEPVPGAAEEGVKPAALDAPRDGAADDLKKIKGVGPKLEALLHSMGFYHFDQIASWTVDEIAWVDSHLEGFKGRVTRDNWVEQARKLAGGGETDFSKRVDDGDVY